MTPRRMRAAKGRAMRMAAASTLKASLRDWGGDSIGGVPWGLLGGKIGLRCTKPTLPTGCAWVFELAGEVFRVRLEQTDTGATARHATTHATEGGGVVNLLHLEKRLKQSERCVKVPRWIRGLGLRRVR